MHFPEWLAPINSAHYSLDNNSGYDNQSQNADHKISLISKWWRTLIQQRAKISTILLKKWRRLCKMVVDVLSMEKVGNVVSSFQKRPFSSIWKIQLSPKILVVNSNVVRGVFSCVCRGLFNLRSGPIFVSMWPITQELFEPGGVIISIFAPKGDGDYSREGNYLREAIISNISHRRLCSKYFVLLYNYKVKYMSIIIRR